MLSSFHLPVIRLNRRQAIWLATGVVTVAIAVLGLALGMPAIERQLNRWQLLPQTAQPTELSFTTPELLSHTYKPGSQQSITFVVANNSAHPRTYRFTLTETDASGQHTVTLLDGLFVVPAKSQYTWSKGIGTQDMGPRVYLGVHVDNSLSIGYWATRK